MLFRINEYVVNEYIQNDGTLLHRKILCHTLKDVLLEIKEIKEKDFLFFQKELKNIYWFFKTVTNIYNSGNPIENTRIHLQSERKSLYKNLSEFLIIEGKYYSYCLSSKTITHNIEIFVTRSIMKVPDYCEIYKKYFNMKS